MNIQNSETGSIILLVILISVILYELLMYLRGKSSESWRRHTARVLKVEIKVREDDGLDQSKASVTYQYTYMGSHHSGNKVSYGDIWSTNYGDSCDDITGVIKGADIDIYVNPKSPSMSVMQRGYRGNVLWPVGLLLAVILLVVIR